MAGYTEDRTGHLNFGGVLSGQIARNYLNSNPIRVECPGTIISQETLVQSLSWVDSDNSIHVGSLHVGFKNGSDLIMTINGVLYQLNIPLALSSPWKVKLFHPVVVGELTVTIIGGGSLLIWTA